MLTISEKPPRKLRRTRLFVIITGLACYLLAELSFNLLVGAMPMIKKYGTDTVWHWVILGTFTALWLLISIFLIRNARAKQVAKVPQALILDLDKGQIIHHQDGKLTQANFRYFVGYIIKADNLILEFELKDTNIIRFSIPRVIMNNSIKTELDGYQAKHLAMRKLYETDQQNYHLYKPQPERIYKEVRYPGHHWNKKTTGYEPTNHKKQLLLQGTVADPVSQKQIEDNTFSPPSDNPRPSLKIKDRQKPKPKMNEDENDNNFLSKINQKFQAIKNRLQKIKGNTSKPEIVKHEEISKPKLKDTIGQAKPTSDVTVNQDNEIDPRYGVRKKDLKYMGLS